MAEVRWIKIVTDIFDDEKILLIESMPERDGIIVIWFKLLCLAGKQNNGGVFLLNDRIPYTDEMLSTIFRRPLNTVRLALQTFEQFGMVEIVNDTITIPKWDKHQKLDNMELVREQTRKRVEKYREKQRQIAFNGNNQCQYCGGLATGLDHIIPISKGGQGTDDNLVQCCIECNRMKNDKPLVEFLNAHRDRINDEVVLANQKLTRYVTLSNVTNRYVVTQSNADRIDKIREDKNREDIEEDRTADKPQKHKHGEFKHVLLTDAEYQKLIADYGESVTAKYIKKVDEYCEQSGRRYKNYNLAIRNTFMARDNVKPAKQEEDEYDWGNFIPGYGG